MDEDDLRHEVCPVARAPGLYLTDWVGAASVNEANILGITHILSIMTTAELSQYGPDETKGVELRHLDVEDEGSSDILQYFPKECDWIDEVLSKPSAAGGQAGLIVHCQQGVSRSVAFVAAYLMRKHNLSYDEALKLVKSSRSIVNLNPGFEGQLRAWEQKLKTTKNGDEPPTPKSPVNEINSFGVIDFVEAEMNER